MGEYCVVPLTVVPTEVLSSSVVQTPSVPGEVEIAVAVRDGRGGLAVERRAFVVETALAP